MKTAVCTLLALIAFAGNSILGRLALDGAYGANIDPASFTSVRLFSAFLVLIVLVFARRFASPRQPIINSKGSWFAGVMLFSYAVHFSFAYLELETGTGALVLFASVQLTMILVAFWKGERLGVVQVVGFVFAFAGLVFLMLPGASAPSLLGFTLMLLSGIAWGLYSLSGAGAGNALTVTTYNFIRTTPLVVLLVLFFLLYKNVALNPVGVSFAILSGAITSGLGYAIWSVHECCSFKERILNRYMHSKANTYIFLKKLPRNSFQFRVPVLYLDRLNLGVHLCVTPVLLNELGVQQ